MIFRSYSKISEYFLHVRDYVAIAIAILRLVKTTCYPLGEDFPKIFRIITCYFHV